MSPEEASSIGSDIWIRARTNAFAHELALGHFTNRENWFFALRAFFTTLPIVLTSLTLGYFSQNLQLPEAERNLAPILWLSQFVILSNGVALFLTLIVVKLRWGERAHQYKEQLNMYAMIAQKARRLEDPKLSGDEALPLSRQLQELFEMAKSRGVEPADRFFSKAKRMIANLNTYPFGIDRNLLVANLPPEPPIGLAAIAAWARRMVGR